MLALVVQTGGRARERRDQGEERRPLLRAHALRRYEAVLSWPRERSCPASRLAEAWMVARYGPEGAAHSIAAGAYRRARRAIELYERFSEARPAQWPVTGPAALIALASQRRAEHFAGDVERLLVLARQMRAAVLERDPRRRERQARSAARRATPVAGPLAYRRAPRWETAEQRRRRVRAAVLLADGDPALWPNAELAGPRTQRQAIPALIGDDPCDALDGIGGRAARFRDELARGRYRLPPDWTRPPTPQH